MTYADSRMTDTELQRATHGTSSQVVRVLMDRVIWRGVNARQVRADLLAVQAHIQAGRLAEALALIDKCRETLAIENP